jgi:hypothetical protein
MPDTCPVQKCTTHADCADSGTCLPGGACAPTAQVASVNSARGTENASCSGESPCSTIAGALATGRPYIRLHGTFDESVVIGDGRQVALFADADTTLTSSAADVPVVRVAGAKTDVSIYDLHIAKVINDVNVFDVAPDSGSPSLALHHVTLSRNPGLAISIGDGTFTMDRSTLDENAGGGLMIFNTARFCVTNSLIIKNGSPQSSCGGICLSSDANEPNFVALTTEYGNISQRGTSAGISCFGAQTVITDSIVVSNGLSGSTTSQADGNCTVRHTLVYPGPPLGGEANIAQDPRFVDPARDNYHPGAGSPAIGAGDSTIHLACDAARDLDNTNHPDPPTIGAFEPVSQGP